MKKKISLIFFALIFLAYLVYAAPSIDFISPTPSTATSQTQTNTEINISIAESNLNSLTYNWNGINHTMYNESLVLMMNFDNVSELGESSTKSVDVSKYSNNASITGPIVNASGKFNGAIKFDGGNNDLVEISKTSSTNVSTFTISAWIKADVWRDNRWQGTIISNDRDSAGYAGYVLRCGDGGTLSFALRNDVDGDGVLYDADDSWPEILSKSMSLGVWHHTLATYDGNTMKMFLDGVEKNSTIGGNHLKNPGNISIGNGYDLNRGFNGLIDEVRIWDRSLSSEEVYQQYISNLQKFNSTQWYLYVNQSKSSTAGLDLGTYTYQTFAKDSSGASSSTEQRTLTISLDAINPLISFIPPTPSNTISTFDTSIQVNVSIIEQNMKSLTYNWNSVNYTFYNESLVLMLNFDNLSSLGENSTHSVDVSSYGLNGTLVGNPSYSNGKHNLGLDFIGNGQYVNLGDNAITDVIDKFTYSAWIKPRSYVPCGGIIGKYHDAGTLGSVFRLKCVSPYNTIDMNEMTSSTYVIPLDTWTQVTGVVQSGVVSLYINGILNASGNSGYTLANNNDALLIGVDFLVSPRYFNGSIDEVRIWNRSLDAGEVYQQYASNLQKFNSTHWYLYVNQSKNATAPLGAGTYTYQSFVSDTSGNTNSTEQRTITISSSETTPSCPAIPQNWNVNAGENVILNTPCNITGYNMTFSGSGTFTVNNTLYLNNFNSFSSGVTVLVKPNGIIYPRRI